MKHRTLHVLGTAALVLALGTAHAEDIDLFVGTPPTAAQLPNVLFVVDNTANWNTAFTNEMSALANTFINLPVNPDGTAKFRVGILFASETGGGNSDVEGGYIRAAIRNMNSTNKPLYRDLILSFDRLADRANGGASSLMMSEAYFYFSGGTPNSGNNKNKTDFTGNTYTCGNACPAAARPANDAVYALSGNALPSRSATTYTSPVGNGCGKNYIIYISNGPNQENNSRSTTSNGLMAAAGGDTSLIPLSPTGSQNNPSDEWARFMKNSDLGVVTYTIDVDPITTGQGPGWTALLKSMASVSGGKYTAVNSGVGGGSEIADAINKALSEIQAVNSVFASVSLPVSVNTQGTFLNQVYIGLFRPDPGALPRWNGNLKQYKLGFINNVLRLQDADSASAINNLTGFITECARSFWTPSTTDSYWAFSPQGNCITPVGETPYINSNFPDGNVVEKGAQAYVLRSSTTRALKTCSPTFGSCTTLTDFNTGNAAITQALLGAGSSTERDALINWARGLDVNDEHPQDGVTPTPTPLASATTSTVMRPSAHGDTVHSRPVALNFGTDASPQVVVFYGGNDGVFRAINGNRSADIGTRPPGAELWSFLPPEFYGKIKRLRDNTTQISFPNVTTAGALPKPYGVDGSVTAYRAGSTAWIYTTLRRGGRALYAFDVDTSNLANITLKWKKGCPNSGNDTDCTTGFSGIGQTWSAPKTLKASGYGGGTAPIMIVGGGYDPCEDADAHTCANNSTAKGSKVYVLDADTGALLRTLNTNRSVVADVFVVPDLSTDLAIYAYVVDTGGNVYRIDIGNAAPAAWTITRIAALGCSNTVTNCARNRKFQFAPDVVKEGDEYILLLGSGDREKPLRYASPSSNDVSNYFFMLRDKPTDANWLSSLPGDCAGVICRDALFQITRNSTTAPDPVALDAKKGWYLEMNTAEQVVTAAITIFGTVTFSTHEPSNPSPDSCENDLGTSRVYNVSYKNAQSANGTDTRYQLLPPVGLPPSPVAGMVILDDGTTVPFCIGCTPDSPLEGGEPPVPPTTTPNQPKGRVYWFIEK